MKTKDQAAIMARKFRQGKTEAVQYIYKTHYRPLCAYAGKMVGNQLEAEDIAIDSILKLLERKECFETLPAISSFLYVSVRNACVDILRAAQRRNISHREITYLTAATAEDEANWEKDRMSIVREIYVQVENLPPKCREVFKQLFYKRKSTARVARGMGISTQTVLNQKTKAIGFLRTALQKKELIHVNRTPV